MYRIYRNTCAPGNLKTIGDYAFFDVGLGGTLQIPDQVTSIGSNAFKISDSSLVGFSGKLTIPASVESLGSVAFSGNKKITSVEFEGNKLTQIPDSVFRYCGLNGAVVIPPSVQKIGRNVFDSTNLKTIYLPKRTDESNTAFINSGTFGTFSNSKLTAIVCHKEDFSVVCSTLGSQFSKKTGYEISVSFVNGGSAEPIDRLYNLPYNYTKDDQGVWSADSTYRFPQIQGKKWGLTENAVSPVSETDIIKQEKLYPISALEDPVITFGDGIDKVYDGEPAALKVTAEHPMAKPIGKAKTGDVVFYYTWSWGTITSSSAVLKGFDENTYNVTDVREPRFPISCGVRVQACLVNGTKATPLYTVDHDFTVHLRQAEPEVNPVYPKGMTNISEGMPQITLSKGDTKGTISWDKDQIFEVGKKEYRWTFVPDKNTDGNYNYASKSGTAVLNLVDGKVFKATVHQAEHGHITPEGEFETAQGSLTEFRIKPDAGYRLKSVSMNGRDVTGEIENDVYTLHNIQSDYEISAVFAPLSAADMKKIADQLPQAASGKPLNEEEKISILDAKQHFDALPETSQEEVPEASKKKLREAILSLPQVQTEVSGNLQLNDQSLLLDNMTSADVQKLYQNDRSFKIEVVAADTRPDRGEAKAIEGQLHGATIYKNMDIRVIKTVVENNKKTIEDLSVLRSPIRIVFDIPEEIRAPQSGAEREFFIIRAHKADGKITAELLTDQDDSDATVTVDSDQYSVYAIAYKDSGISGKDPQIQTPKEERYEVVFDSRGGSSVPSIKNIKYGDHIQAPHTPNRKGFSFTGWYKQKECKDKWNFNEDIITENRVLYAGWKESADVGGSLSVTNNSSKKSKFLPKTEDSMTFNSAGRMGISIVIMALLYRKRRKL